MATLLELVKDLADESGVEESSNITTVVGVTDTKIKDLIRWIRWANRDIERRRDDWFFRIKEGEIELEQGEPRYDVTLEIPDFHKIVPYKHPKYAASIIVDGDSLSVVYIPYERWAGRFDVMLANTSEGQPRNFTRLPSGELEVFPKPSTNFTLKFNYLRKPQMMSLQDECEPAIPEMYDSVILWFALLRYVRYDEAQVRKADAQAEFDQAYMDLVSDQAPTARMINPPNNRLI